MNMNAMLMNMGMKPGDWMCASCGDHQFAKNETCRKCGAPKSGGGPGMMGNGMMGMKKKAGDWHCPNCNDLQFAKNLKCRKCDTPNPDPEGSKAAMELSISNRNSGQSMKPGDWICPGCNDLQFAKNKNCRKCNTPNPDPQGSIDAASASGNWKPDSPGPDKKPGDWTCSKCGDHQFAKNVMCRKCGHPKMPGMCGKGAMAAMMGGMCGKGGMGMMGGMGGMGGGMGGMGGGMGAMGGGMGDMVLISQEMLANLMGCKGGGKGDQGMGGKSKGGSKGGNDEDCRWCAKGECWTHGKGGGGKGGRYSPW